MHLTPHPTRAGPTLLGHTQGVGGTACDHRAGLVGEGGSAWPGLGHPLGPAALGVITAAESQGTLMNDPRMGVLK